MHTKSLALFNRLTDVEKIGIRGASQDRLIYLTDADFRSDFHDVAINDRVSIMQEVQALVELQYKAKVEATFGKPGACSGNCALQ